MRVAAGFRKGPFRKPFWDPFWGPKWDPNGSEQGQAGTKRPQEGTKTLENRRRSDMPKPS